MRRALPSLLVALGLVAALSYVDYRLLRLGNGPAYSPVHRIYAGLNLKF